MSRKQSREVAFKLLFSLSFDRDSGGFSPEVLELALSEGSKVTIDDVEMNYIKNLCDVVKINLKKIDDLIEANARDFSFDRIFKADLTVLRMSVGEILFVPETPAAVAINEAVTLAKKYSTEKSASYINGILASILKGHM